MIVIGRMVWIALRVLVAEDKCPACGKWAKFVPAEERLVFGEKRAA